MKPLNRKLKKTLLIVLGIIIIVVVMIIAFISPITKYLVEKYDEQYTGRQIKIGMPYVNPFTGFIHFGNFRVFESHSDSIFFSAEGLNINFAILKMLSKTYEITELTLNNPKCKVIQNKQDFNFNDLLEKFTPEQKDTTLPPVHFNLLGFKINDGEFYYNEKDIPINYFIKNVKLDCSGMRWDDDTVAAKFSLTSGIGSGDISGYVNVNTGNNNYRLAATINQLDLKLIGQYLKDIINYGTLRAFLNADIKATGNFDHPDSLNARGRIEINDFHFGKNSTNDYASFDKLVLAINQLNPGNYKYLFDSITLLHPYFKYEMYDGLDNFETMFGKNGANIETAKADPKKFNLILEIADYVKELAKNFFQSYYKVNTLRVTKGDLKFNDYSLSEKFSMAANPFTITADSIGISEGQSDIILKSDIQPYGDLAMKLSVDPKDSGDFNLEYYLQKVPLTVFNPYVIATTSFPLDRGTLEFNGGWKVTKGEINSKNHLVVIDPSRTKRIKNKEAKHLPLPLIMAFIRESGNVIDYEIPITGSLKNPHIHTHDIIFDALENIFVKPVMTPYRLKVSNAEEEIEKALKFKWLPRQNHLRESYVKFVEEMVEFLEENPEASMEVYPKLYAQKEKEYILFFEAKKKYFLQSGLGSGQFLTEQDSDKVDNMSIKDSLFLRYLNKHVNDALQFTVQEKCSHLISESIVNEKFNRLNKERKEAFLFLFKEKGVDNRIKIHEGENIIPFNGFSFYKIEYKGEIPKSLRKAYEKMHELNDESPRKKYEKDRERIKGSVN
ncbi:MAG: DUF748 domain-containing protein [Bacteroidia bacterium]